MTELTQKLLLLDTQIDTELTKTHASAQKVMLDADILAKEMIDTVKQRMKKQKENDLNTLFKKVKKQKEIQEKALSKQMKDFDKEIKFEYLIENIISIAKKNLCP